MGQSELNIQHQQYPEGNSSPASYWHTHSMIVLKVLFVFSYFKDRIYICEYSWYDTIFIAIFKKKKYKLLEEMPFINRLACTAFVTPAEEPALISSLYSSCFYLVLCWVPWSHLCDRFNWWRAPVRIKGGLWWVTHSATPCFVMCAPIFKTTLKVSLGDRNLFPELPQNPTSLKKYCESKSINN